MPTLELSVAAIRCEISRLEQDREQEVRRLSRLAAPLELVRRARQRHSARLVALRRALLAA